MAMTKQQERIVATVLDIYAANLEPVFSRNLATTVIRSVDNQDDLIAVTQGLLKTLPHVKKGRV